MINEQNKIVYSKACGKVLIVGGYGVLQKQNIGLCLALQNYFYCKLQQLSSLSQTKINVYSPQINKQYTYFYNYQSNKLIQQKQQQNAFVQNALFYSLQYFKLLSKSGEFNITLTFDKGFISQKQTSNNQSKFINYSLNYSKTGLGSSACVVVSIVSAIFALMNQRYNKNLINVISQIANLSAQKKIGSNFDISTAIFGTHLYKNVLPELAFKTIQNNQYHNLETLTQINPQIQIFQTINQLIKNQSIGFLIDVSKGANTRVMVSNFLKSLKNQSQQVQRQFYDKSKDITRKLYKIIQNQNITNDHIKKDLNHLNEEHRQLQQKYSKITKTPVQPQQYKDMIDELIRQEGILYVICPGSGGYDALFMLCENNKSEQQYRKVLQRINDKNRQKLGEGVRLNLKRVNIKWDKQMQVTKQQVEEIEKYLKSNQINE